MCGKSCLLNSKNASHPKIQIIKGREGLSDCIKNAKIKIKSFTPRNIFQTVAHVDSFNSRHNFSHITYFHMHSRKNYIDFPFHCSRIMLL